MRSTLRHHARTGRLKRRHAATLSRHVLDRLESRVLLSTLVWQEEFDGALGSLPNSATWNYQTGGGGWGNNERQTYTTSTDNMKVVADANAGDGKALQITAIRTGPGTNDYTSARINTQDKFNFTYGYVEIRAKLPMTQGTWPAFWMMGDTGGGWPNNGEIDILENKGTQPSTSHHTIHGPGYSGGGGPTASYTLPSGRFDDGYHLWQMEWKENSIQWWVDGQMVMRNGNPWIATPATVAPDTWVFNNREFYFLLNLAIGGNTFAPDPIPSSVFPQNYLIDYIRVYQDLPGPVINVQPQSQTITVGDPVTFTVNASGSALPLTYQWERAPQGSGIFSPILNATNSSYSIGSVAVGDNGSQFRVVVTDNAALSVTSNIAVLTVTTNHAPTGSISINSGLRGGKFDAGTLITFSGTGSDIEDGSPLAASKFTWKIDYLTATSGADTDFDGLPGSTSAYIASFGNTTSSSFTPATSGTYKGTDVAYVITMTLTDSGGRTFTTTSTILPNITSLTVNSATANLTINVDGVNYTTTRTFDSVAGFQHAVSTPTLQNWGGTTYNFSNWSDAGAASHNITAPISSTTYTANFTAAPGWSAFINFQTADSAGFVGYVPDTGSTYGARSNGFTFGWSADNTALMRNRNSANAPDERYDTLGHMQNGGNKTWEILVPSATYSAYTVHLVAGDPGFFDSVNSFTIDGTVFTDPDGNVGSGFDFDDFVKNVTVTDGKLTITPTGTNAKICFIEITAVVSDGTPPTVATPAAAAPTTVTGTSSNLSVLGADNNGEAGLIYTWSVVTKPAGAPDPTFTVNGTNAAKNSTANFTHSGNYVLRATIKDAANNTVSSDTSSVSVTFGFTGITGGTSHITYAGGTAYTVFADTGTVNFASDLSAGGKTVTLNIAAGATGVLNSAQTLAAVSINAGSTLNVPFSTPRRVIKANALTINATGALDLFNNDMIVDYGTNSSPLATIETYIRTGRNNGSWNGSGIRSTTVAGNASLNAINSLDNNVSATPFDTFGGINTASHKQVLLRFTYVDDVDLDGKIHTNDAITFATYYSDGATGSHYAGDINYDGVVNFNDAILFATAYNESLPQIAGAESGGFEATPITPLAAPSGVTSSAVTTSAPKGRFAGANAGWTKGTNLITFSDTASGNAAFFSVKASATEGITLSWRTRAGGAISTTKLRNVKQPVTLKVVQSASTFTAYYSVDGAKWIKIGSSHNLKLVTPANNTTVFT